MMTKIILDLGSGEYQLLSLNESQVALLKHLQDYGALAYEATVQYVTDDDFETIGD